MSERTDRNREYLADLVAEGEISPFKKDIADLSDAYVDRMAGQFHAQESLGLPFDRAAARGHAETEHGRAVERDYEPEIYQRARELSEYEGVQADTQGRVFIDADVFDFADLADLADVIPDSGRITIHTDDVDLFTHGGISPEGLQALVDKEYGGDWDDMIEDQIDLHTYNDEG